MILSIDVGIRNLAMCLIDENDQHIKQWDVSGIPPNHKDGVFKCMNHHLNEREWVLSATTILIEKQPDKNRKMKTVENFLHAYMIIKNPDAECIIYDARHKIPDVAGPGKGQYYKRKQTSIIRCKEYLDKTEINHEWLPIFKESKKKDDLADTVMQALSFINRREVVPNKKAKKSTKLVARKPNENQKETKYSKSNLAWFCKNYTDDLLSKNKRFMKDLKRYYHCIEDLKKDL